MVSCHLNNAVYIRKSVEKRFALRTRDVRAVIFSRKRSPPYSKPMIPSNAHLNSNAISFFRPSRQTLDGHPTSFVLSKLQPILISSWIMLKAERFGTFWNQVLMMAQFQSRILIGGHLKLSAQFTGVILKDSPIGTLYIIDK